MKNASLLYACPVCEHPLTEHDNTLRCDNGHTFDRHKKGYVNLLLAHKKRSKSPGDDADMVNSRRRFLEQAHYQPLVQAITSGLKQRLAETANILDAGCGEGYYTSHIAQTCSNANVLGLDISKPAIHLASKNKQVSWCVASSSQPPYLPESIDCIVSVFSRVDCEPFHKLLKVGGWVCMATADSEHLLALRSLIYEEVKSYNSDKHNEYFDERFALKATERINTEVELNSSQAVFDLLGMTPHAHRLTSAARERLTKTNALKDKASFKLYWFQKVN